MSLKLITPAATMPVTLAEAKAQCRVDIDDDDDLITSMILAATEMCEQFTGRAIMAQTWRLTLDQFPDGFELTKIPVQSVASVKYINTSGVETTLSGGAYTLSNADDTDSAYVIPAYGYEWPTARSQANACYVDYVAGYSTVPEAIKHWILMTVASMYEYRESFAERELKAGFALSLLDRYKVY